MKNYFYTVWTSKKIAVKIKHLEINLAATWGDKKQQIRKNRLI